jgi:hypothetical protein
MKIDYWYLNEYFLIIFFFIKDKFFYNFFSYLWGELKK